MIDLNVLQTLVVGHLWQSVALAALLAAVLIFGRRMRGATRYGLSGAAFIAAIVLPLSAFIPGESLVRTLLNQLEAPKAVASVAAPAQAGPSPLERIALENGAPAWATKVATNIVKASTHDGAVPLSQTDIGKNAMEDGAPAWALDLGGRLLQAAVEPAAAAPPPAPKALFALPEFSMPNLDLPDLTLPLALVWLAGTIMLLVRTVGDLVAVERLVARAKPLVLPDALRRRMGDVRVASSNEAPGPMAAGLFRPCIVLPESIALGSPGMAALLEHERAHIERNDMLVALIQRLTLAVLWWSPALHWISRRIDEEREVSCDETAVERTGDARAFARSLTSQAENQLWARAPRLAVGAIGPRSQVGRRIKRLIEIAKGAAPAKYAGRLGFAGLALAVAVAAMVTPRFNANAQQPPPPVDDSLASGPIDLLQQAQKGGVPQPPEAPLPPRPEALAGGPDGEFAGLSDELNALMRDVSRELEVAFAGLSPELELELQGLSGEMAALGAEISLAVGQELAQQMPQIMAEVRASLAKEGIDIDDWSDLEGLSGYDPEELRQALQEARDEIHDRLGPEMREEIRQSIAEAREELAEHRDEIHAAVEQSRAGMEVARAAMAKARAEIDAARARGDFETLRDFDFDLDEKTLQKLRDLDIDVQGSGLIRIKGGKDYAGPSYQLMRAASRGDMSEVRRLIIEEKADVNAVFPGDGTALIEAARKGRLDVVRMLLDAGAEADIASPGDGNALIVAAQRGREDVVKLLLDRGADANGPSPGDGNALIAAAQHGEAGIAKLLISRGANVNAYVKGDETPLINAAEQGELEIVKLLVDRGAKVNLAYMVDRSWDGSNRRELRSPLNMAEKHGQDEIAAYLRSKGAVAAPKPAN